MNMLRQTALVLEQVRNRLGDPAFNPPSSRSVARVLGVSHTQVSRYDKGASLDLQSFLRAMRYLDPPAPLFVEAYLSYIDEICSADGTAEFFREKFFEWCKAVKS